VKERREREGIKGKGRKGKKLEVWKQIDAYEFITNIAASDYLLIITSYTQYVTHYTNTQLHITQT